jgi:phage terminase Nu1 subunit (DNA packaging protein)
MWLLLQMGHKKRCNQAELSRILGVRSPTLSKFKHDPTFPDFDNNNEVEIYAGCVWWYLRKEANPVPAEPDMLAGTESDGLERYRLARAQQEEIKLAEQRGQIVRLNDFDEMAQAVLGPYRRLAEHVKRIGNPDLWQLVEEANAEVAGGLERLYGHADAATSDSVGPIRNPGGEGDS